METKKTISPESILELQKLDCNCNDCAFMVRDMETYKKWETFHREVQQNEFEKRVLKLNKQIDEYYKTQEFTKGLALEKELRDLKYVFDKSYVTLNYGTCSKFNKPVNFIPNTVQLETQNCFKHRREQ